MTALVDDVLLPAAPYLTSDAAADVIAPAVAATGAQLVSCSPVQVQYRPGSELVVRYRVETAGADGQVRRATVMAGTTVNGPPAGALLVEGDGLTVGVWQWPFDPVLTGLERAVTPDRAAALVGWRDSTAELEVIVYRPTERAVVRATDADGRRVYVKVVPPPIAEALVRRHRVLGEAGLPVPAVVAADVAAGLIVLAELTGPTLRELLKAAAPVDELPPATDFADLRRRLAGVPLGDLPRRPSRTTDAAAHARMLAEVLPGERARLDRIVAVATRHELPAVAVVHGDLHEAQLIVEGGRITGLLDIDDVAPGAALDDLATTLGHLRYRAATDTDPARAAATGAYADRLADEFAGELEAEGVARPALDAATAAVLVGLATGPFRIQMPDWQTTTRTVLGRAEQLIAEQLMREVSGGPHRDATTHRHDQGVGRAAGIEQNPPDRSTT